MKQHHLGTQAQSADWPRIARLEIDHLNWGTMRFVLYFFTWMFVVATISNLVEGNFDGFGTGLFLSGLMLWWSKSVRDRRRRKLGIVPKKSPGQGSKLTRAVRAASQEWSGSAATVATPQASPSEEAPVATPTVEAAKEPEPQAEDQELTPETSAPVKADAVSEEIAVEEKSDIEAVESQVAPTEGSSVAETTPVTVDEKAIERQFWKDARGNDLNVGSQVSFLANSRGESVSIAGILVGEQDGKALIQVQKGALLPANDYAIPWTVVSLRD